MPSPLHEYGWNATVHDRYLPFAEPDKQPVRVVRVDRGWLQVATTTGVERARPERLLDIQPATGDWAAARREPDAGLVVTAVVPRTSAVKRLNPAGNDEQVLVANVDTMFVLHGLDRPHRVGRLERLCILTWDAGAHPVIVLTKTDLVGTDEAAIGLKDAIAEIRRVLHGVDVIPVSSATGAGIEDLSAHLGAGVTVGLVGESGAGKSTLVNRLVGADVQLTGRTRHGDYKGRHTTTSRELIPLASGAVLVDTPGLRTVAMHGGEAGLATAYEDLEALFRQCRFRDCSHGAEPGCAIAAALAGGELSAGRWAGYQKLLKEIDFESRRASERERRAAAKKEGKQLRRVRRGQER